MTLDDHEWPISTLAKNVLRSRREKFEWDRPIWGFLREGRQTNDSGVVNNGNIRRFGGYFLENFRQDICDMQGAQKSNLNPPV